MASIGTLAVNIVARITPFTHGLDRARGALGKFAGSIGGALRSVTGLAAGLAGLGGAAGLGAVIKQSLDAIDNMDDLATRLGITTETLAGVAHGASFAGVGLEQFGGAVQKMVINVGKFAGGGGAAAKQFANFGLSAEKLAGLSTDEMLFEIAEQISKIPTHAKQAAAAVEIFGKQGAALVPILSGGRQGLMDFIKEAEKLGLTFTAEQAAMAAAANDAMARVGAAFRGTFQQIAIQSAPVIEALSNQFLEQIKHGQGIREHIGGAFIWVAKSVGIFADVLDVVADAFKGLRALSQQWLAFLSRDLATIVRGLENFLNRLPGVHVQFSGFTTALAEEMTKAADEQSKMFWDSFMADPPSAKINKWVEDLNKNVGEAAKKRPALAAGPSATAPLGLGAVAGRGLAAGAGSLTGFVRDIVGKLQLGRAGLAAGFGALAAHVSRFRGRAGSNRLAESLEAGSAEGIAALRRGNPAMQDLTTTAKSQLGELRKHTALFSRVGDLLGKAISQVVTTAIPK